MQRGHENVGKGQKIVGRCGVKFCRDGEKERMTEWTKEWKRLSWWTYVKSDILCNLLKFLCINRNERRAEYIMCLYANTRGNTFKKKEDNANMNMYDTMDFCWGDMQ